MSREQTQTHRISDLETRLQQAERERDYFRSRLDHSARVEAQSQAELARQTAMLRTQHIFVQDLLQHLPGGFAYFDTDKVFRMVNPTYCRLFDKTPEQLLDRVVSDVFPGAGEIIEEVLRTGHEITRLGHHLWFLDTCGLPKTFWDFTVSPIRDDAGVVTGCTLLCFEVTDRLEKERLQSESFEGLRRADQFKDEFLSVVSHELRTPLNFIMGFASILDDELHGPLNEAQHGDVEKILHGAERMLKLVNDLLDVAKIQAGRLDLVQEPSDVRALVDEVVSSLAPLAASKPVTLQTELVAVGCPVVDQARITQVLTNLVGNAIKFTPPDGRVTVRALERPGAFVLEVEDTGIGIAPDHLPRLFQRFQQLDMSNTREAGGAGLGLAIAKALVDAHGATLEVESVLSEGSLFRMILPKTPS